MSMEKDEKEYRLLSETEVWNRAFHRFCEKRNAFNPLRRLYKLFFDHEDNTEWDITVRWFNVGIFFLVSLVLFTLDSAVAELIGTWGITIIACILFNHYTNKVMFGSYRKFKRMVKQDEDTDYSS